MVINCANGSDSSSTPVLLPVYDATGKIVAMSQISEDLPHPPLVVHLQATAKVNIQTIYRGGSHNRCLQAGLQGPHEQPILQRWPAKNGRNTHITILELEPVWMACHIFKEAMSGKTSSFQMNNTTAAAYLLKVGGMHCKTLNGIVCKILLKCHKNRVTVCQNTSEVWQTSGQIPYKGARKFRSGT